MSFRKRDLCYYAYAYFPDASLQDPNLICRLGEVGYCSDAKETYFADAKETYFADAKETYFADAKETYVI